MLKYTFVGGSRLGLALVLVLTSMHGGRAVAQLDALIPAAEPATVTTTSAPDDLKRIEADLAAAGAELRAVREKIATAEAEGDKVPQSLRRTEDALQKRELLLQQQQAAAERAVQFVQAKAGVDAKLAALREDGPAEDRPFSLMLLDQLRDSLKGQSAEVAALSLTTQSSQDNLEEAKTDLAGRESARRQAKESAQSNKDPAETAKLAAAHQQARTESEFAAATLRLRELEHRNEQTALDTSRLRETFLAEKIAMVAPEVRFTKDDLTTSLAGVDEREFELKRSLDSAKLNLNYLETQWQNARQRLEQGPEDDPVLAAEVAARRLARQSRQWEITVLTKRLERLDGLRQAWRRRFDLARRSPDAGRIAEWGAEAEAAIEQLDRDERVQRSRLEEARRDHAAIGQQIEEAEGATPEMLRWLYAQQREARGLTKVYEEEQASLEAARGLHGKLLAETQSGHVRIGDRLVAVWGAVMSVWRFELASVDDRPITVGKILAGLVLLVIGVWLSRVISGLIGRRLLRRFGLNESAASALQTVVFYVLVLSFAVFALHLVSVPLGVFTVLGGALAIGIGFGSQNVMNNFISGLIILAERPIKIHDLVQIGDLYGTIQRIGARSTQVRTSSNIDIIVPNSSFLEQNVINWTLADNRVRTKVVVGVNYGSPTDLVSKLMYRAASEHGKVLKSPEPVVLFTDFGDNALVFEVHFWIHMRSQFERLTIESDLRFRIDGMCREAGVGIAFPQRDIHLDTVKPLEVRVIPQDHGAQSTQGTTSDA